MPMVALKCYIKHVSPSIEDLFQDTALVTILSRFKKILADQLIAHCCTVVENLLVHL